jgi:hypothetical protein
MMRGRFERVPVSRPGWIASGATNCTHVESGAQVWLHWDCDRWVYALPNELGNLLKANESR